MLKVTLAGWAATVGVIAALFALDLFVSRPGHAHTVGFREAAAASAFFVSVAIAFGVVFGVIAGWDFGAEYFAGYIVEKSLSVDNLFVFVVIMSTFAVPAEHQQRVLTFGILAGAGDASGVHRARRGADLGVLIHVPDLRTAARRHGGPAVPPPRRGPRVEENVAGPVTTRLIPVTDRYDGPSVRPGQDGRRVATPLFIVLDRDRQLGPPVRPRLDPGRLRRDRRGVHRVRRECVRAARSARAVLPRGRPPGPARLPLHRLVGDPRRLSASSSSCTGGTSRTTAFRRSRPRRRCARSSSSSRSRSSPRW